MSAGSTNSKTATLFSTAEYRARTAGPKGLLALSVRKYPVPPSNLYLVVHPFVQPQLPSHRVVLGAGYAYLDQVQVPHPPQVHHLYHVPSITTTVGMIG